MNTDVITALKNMIKSRPSFILPVFLLITGFILFSGCELTENQLKMDRAANMEFQDYRDGMRPRIEEEEDRKAALADGEDEGIPALESYIATPAEQVDTMPLVSISVNQTVPLRDVLFELANQADYDIELDPRISGSVIFTARNKPLDVVVSRLSDIAGLRYKFEDRTLRIELDTPYNKSYKLDYLSYIRSSTGTINNTISVVSGEGAEAGSNFEASSSSESDFWGELTTNLNQILASRKATLRTGSTPQITAARTNPAPVAPVVAGGDGATVSPPSAVLEVSSLPVEEEEAAGTAGAASFAVNKQAGILTVHATEDQHEEVAEYLRELKRSVTSQVLIEAKVMEVSLNDEFSAGVDWRIFDLLSGELEVAFDLAGGRRPDLTPASSPTANSLLVYSGDDFTTGLEAISRFGTVRALASPRLTVLNNQAAVLNVASNRVFFEIDIDVTTEEGQSQTEIDSDIRNVPEGVLINVQPSINLDDKTVSMALRPTVTRVVDTVEDPSVVFAAAAAEIDGVSSEIPVVNVQEMDSVVQMNSGEALILGGLMQDRTDATQTGVPVLSEMPVVGNLFKTRTDETRKTELVIFLRATIIEKGSDSIFDVDRDLYRNFSGDRRPLDL